MQRDGQRHGQLFLAELLDAWNDAAGGDDDPSWADRKPLRIGDAAHRFDHGLVVDEGLAHAHENHVREAHPLGSEQARRVDSLLLDLMRVEVATKRKPPRRAEGTPHRAARLRRDAEC